MKRRLFLLCTLVPVLCTLSCGILGGGFKAYVTAKTGMVKVYRAGGSEWQTLDTADVVGWGDTVRCGGKSLVELTFGDGNVVRVDEKSKVHFSSVKDDKGNRLLEAYNHHGTLLSNINNIGAGYDRYRVRTPEAVVEAPGTYFCVTYELHARTADVAVIDGEVYVVYPEVHPEPVVVTPGFSVIVPWGRPPRAPSRMSRVRWRRVERVMNPPVALVRPKARLRGVKVAPVHRVRQGKPGKTTKAKVRRPQRSRGPGVIKGGKPAKAARTLRPAAGKRGKPGLKASPARKGPGVKAGPAKAKPGVRKSKPGVRKAPAAKSGVRKSPGPKKSTGKKKAPAKKSSAKKKEETKKGGKGPKGPFKR